MTQPRWCGVLGPLEVRSYGRMVRLGGPHQRAMLGLLALQPNMVVHRVSILEALWGAAPPATAITMIHSHVSQLRKLLPIGTDSSGMALARVGSGYRLCVDDDELDLLAFWRLTARAAQARDDGDLPAAFRLLGEALQLWRGEPMAGIDLLRDHPLVTALSAARAAAIADYADAARTRPELEKAIPRLRELAMREPMNERAHACLMTALATSGQQAAALEIFRQVRERLDDQLGVQPGAELVATHLRVLRGQQPVLLISDPEPGNRPNPAGHGEQPPPDTAAVPPSQLPTAVPDFTGRRTEISWLGETLGTGRDVGVPVAVLCGLPGIGKTALALRAAHQLRSAFPDGQLWVQLDGTSPRPRPPADVLGELLRTLGVAGAAIPDALAEKEAMYRSRLADRRVLLVADDASSAGQVRPLIPGTTGSAVIVTSREHLTELPAARILPLGLPERQDAIRLLAAIIGEQRVSAEPQAVDQLVTACGRLPLAVRIAGARLAGRPTWPVSLLSAALANQQRRLDELAAGRLSVRASLTVSYQALDAPSQQALCLLSMLGPIDVADWVIGALLGTGDASEVVNKLANSSLLNPATPDATGAPRYRLHDLLCDYGLERLAAGHQRDRRAALQRALDGWLQLARSADARLPHEPNFPSPADGAAADRLPAALVRRLTADPIAWFTAERRNLLTAIDLSCQAGNYRLAARLAAHAASYQRIQNRLDDTSRMWHAIAIAASQGGDQSVAAHAELWLTVAVGNGIGHCPACSSADD